MALFPSGVRHIDFVAQTMLTSDVSSTQPTKLDAHVVRAIDSNNSITISDSDGFRLWPKWYQAVQMRPIEEQNLWTTPIRNGSPSNRKVRHEANFFRRSFIMNSP